MVCPYCKHQENIRKHGTYIRASDGKVCQRYRCKSCSKTFSETHFGIDYRLRKRYLNQNIFRSLCSGVSQRRLALILGVRRPVIARRLLRFGICAQHNLEEYRKNREKVSKLDFDELETFEHSKCKPITAAIAVEDKTRKVLAIAVGRIPAKGSLVHLARKKYGKRPCERHKCLTTLFEELKACVTDFGIVKTDQSRAYPPYIRVYLPKWEHQATPGRRGCVVGQGELKEGAWDPLFSLNHTYAMFRDGLKRLARRTWCTTKKIENLKMALYMYAWFHNLYLDSKAKRNLRLAWIP